MPSQSGACLISKPMNEQLYSSDTWKDRGESLSRRRYFLPSQPEVWVGILAAQVKGKKIQEMGVWGILLNIGVISPMNLTDSGLEK